MDKILIIWKKIKKNKKLYLLILFLYFIVRVIALAIWTVWGNTTVAIGSYIIQNEKIPASFSGYRIAQISDLNNAQFGENNSKILEILKQETPDMIAITGNLISANCTDIKNSVNFAKECVKIAPCYYVTGNNEANLRKIYPKLEQQLTNCGVTVLRDSYVYLERNGEQIQIIGLDDPDFEFRNTEIDESILNSKLSNTELFNGYKILLSHRPETFNAYVENNIDLVLSGHAVGGQFRVPVIGGIISPNQGLFPEYDAGLFSESNTEMIVSRGIGNGSIPIRVNNRPEVVIIELSCEVNDTDTETISESDNEVEIKIK